MSYLYATAVFLSYKQLLQDMFYEKADALVGICKDASTNRFYYTTS